jgi:hypothetical protein
MPLLKAINKQCEELGWLDKLTIMYKLIEKEKMGKPSHITYSKKENKFIGVCRKCHQIVNQKMNYCCSCGKHLDWIEENENISHIEESKRGGWMYKIIKRIIDRTFKVHSPSKWD